MTRSFLTLVVLVFSIGCSRGGGSAGIPNVDAKSASRAALAAYDANQDEFIDEKESEKSPPLKAIWREIDSDSDSKVSAEEIESRIHRWKERNVAIHTLVCNVFYNGAPLPGATVTLVPEEFLGADYPRASGVTSPQGFAMLTVESDKLSTSNLSGVYNGLYRVEISRQQNGRELIPAKYNSATVLGQEVPELGKNKKPAGVKYNLRSGGG